MYKYMGYLVHSRDPFFPHIYEHERGDIWCGGGII